MANDKAVTERECGRTHRGLMFLFSVVGVLLLGAGAQIFYNTCRISTMEVQVGDAAKSACVACDKADVAVVKAQEAVAASALAQKNLDGHLDKLEQKLDRVLSK